jgi:4-hydroxybenzoate polyprenyltransferase
MRPPNLVTAAADVLAGYAVSERPGVRTLIPLLISSSGLYAGGVVLNDAFDAKVDALERPERPIPSGRATVRGAASLGAVLLMGATAIAFLVSAPAGIVALSIALCAVSYDAWGKHSSVIGPVNMAACRGLNLLLGVSAAPFFLGERWYVAVVSFLYVAAITIISRGEVKGEKRATGLLALSMMVVVLLVLLLMGATPGFALLAALPFTLLFSFRVLPPFWRAFSRPEAATIRTAVKTGVLSIILLDAVIAGGYSGVTYGVIVLTLSLVATKAARSFAVT